MEEKYKDPENVNEILEKIRNAPTLGHVKPILDSLYPTWILGSMKAYSNDYSQLQNNWETICKLSKVKPTEIIIVDFIVYDKSESHTLIKIFSEILTKSGFCVRSKNEFLSCKKCGLALPSESLYDSMKQNNIKSIPSRWMPVCENC
jgi:hypothetical protein